MTNSTPITILAMEQRWKLFGHILRSHPSTPAKTIMTKYYTEPNYQKKGRPQLTLPTVLNNDLKLIHTNLVDKLWLDTLTNTAQDRKKWQEFTGQLSTRLKEELDKKRHNSEYKRNVPSSAQLTQHYNDWQKQENLQDIVTPPGLDYRSNKRSPTTRLPRRPKIRRILFILEEESQMEID